MTAVSNDLVNRNLNSRFKGGLYGDRPVMLSEIINVLAALGFTGGGGSTVVQTILDGDSTHSPSSDVLFDALAGKVSNQAGIGLSQGIILKDILGTSFLVTVDSTGFVSGVPYP